MTEDPHELAWLANRRARGPRGRFDFVTDQAFGKELRVRRYRLGNGLDVYLLVDRSAPVVSYHTWFRVGSRHEKRGKTGLAHLFEHLMFNETKHLRAGEFDRKLESLGGETNAATWTDWTYYYDNVPKNGLELVVELEADRMAHLIVRGPQVRAEKEVVANERRYRVDDDVDGIANELLYAKAFRKHPYHWPTIGWMRDIERFDPKDCRAFYETYYAPNNASVIVAGDFDEMHALALIQDHYGRYDTAPIPETRNVREPAQRREQRYEIKRPTPSDKVQLGYRAPAFREEDFAVLVVLNEVLTGGRSSRLFRRLVTESEIATDVHGSVAPFQDPGLAEIGCSARPGHTAEEMLAIIDKELGRIRKQRISEEELEKAKNRLELAFLTGMETPAGKAEQIGFYATVVNDPSRVFARLAEYWAVTPDRARDVAARALEPTQRTVVTVRPTGDA